MSLIHKSKITDEELLSKTISYLRFPLIVGVVFIHNDISTFTLQGIKHEFNNPDWYYYIIAFFSQVLPRISVPLFFFISGFLFFYHTDFTLETYKQKLKGRIKTLLIPYLLWNFIGFLLLSIKHLPMFESVFPSISKIDYNLSTFFNCFWDFRFPDTETTMGSPINYPFWFIRDLMVTVLLTPVIYWLIRYIKIGYILILCICWYCGYHWNISGLNLSVIFFFSLGAYVSISHINLLPIFRKSYFIPFIYIIISIADAVTKEESYNHYIHDIGILLGILSAFTIVSYFIDKGKIRVNKFLSDSSFFIFAMHGLFMGEFMKVLFIILHPQSPYMLLFIYFLVPAITILICIGIYGGLKKYCPQVAKILTGGR